MKDKAQRRKSIMALSPRVIIFSFAGIILAGTLLLILPFSSRTGAYTPFWDALFTATSATCVTGLVVYDTYQYFSPIGQGIILCLIQIGGLGLLTFTTFFNILVGKKLGLRDMQVASDAINADTFEGLQKLIQTVVAVALIVEAIGALMLCATFIPRYGREGVWISVFLAVSAFCNAGFDILGREGTFASLSHYNGNFTVMFTIMALIIIGGLGFVVWRDLLEYRRTRHLKLHTKVVLGMTAGLIIAGFFLFLLLEWNNPRTLGDMEFGNRLSAALFQSVTTRTAGFNSIDIAGMEDITKLGACLLMFIGAAPGSTAGGIKVTTLAVIIMTVIAVIRDKDDPMVLHRRVSKTVVFKAIAVMALSFMAVVVAFAVILFTSHLRGTGVSSIDALFESVSAFATVGLSAGVTGIASIPSKIALSLTMFIGRVGPVTFVLSLALRPSKNRKEVIPEGKIYL